MSGTGRVWAKPLFPTGVQTRQRGLACLSIRRTYFRRIIISLSQAVSYRRAFDAGHLLRSSEGCVAGGEGGVRGKSSLIGKYIWEAHLR